MPITLIHTISDSVELQHDGQTLFRYVYLPKTDPRESPKPYFHPLYTLKGNPVTIFRPHDHLWHHGLMMTSAQLSGQNFWGGPTYVRERGYVQLDNNGRQSHRDWDRIEASESQASLVEHLDWITSDGKRWLDETRRIEVAEIDRSAGCWSLDLRFALANVAGHALHFGSPTVEGRPLAGYGGLFWRGPRSFNKGQILAADGLEGPDVMGKAASWLAFVGRHDGSGDSSTVIFIDRPRNPRYPTKWFVRTEPYACASFAFSFDEELVLEPGETLSLDYRVTIADGALPRDRIEQIAGQGG